MAVEARVIDRNGQQVVVFPDGTEVPLARVQAAMAQQRQTADVQAPPRADAPMSVSAPREKSIGQRMTGLLGDIPNMLNGTGIPERLAVANDFFNPVAGVYGAMDASGQMLAPNRTGYERAGSLAEMLTELAGAGLAGADLVRGGVSGLLGRAR